MVRSFALHCAIPTFIVLKMENRPVCVHFPSRNVFSTVACCFPGGNFKNLLTHSAASGSPSHVASMYGGVYRYSGQSGHADSLAPGDKEFFLCVDSDKTMWHKIKTNIGRRFRFPNPRYCRKPSVSEESMNELVSYKEKRTTTSLHLYAHSGPPEAANKTADAMKACRKTAVFASSY